jgi:hypothetical protein
MTRTQTDDSLIDEAGILPRFTLRSRSLRRDSIYRGISWHSGRRRWQVNVTLCNMQFFIGDFQTEEAAARAFDNFKYWTQDFSRRKPIYNFPEDEPSRMLDSVENARLRLLKEGNPHLPHRHDPYFNPS